MADLVLGLAKSAVEGTLTMAKSAIEEEKKLKKNVQRDLVLISDEFEMMHSFLSVTKERVTGGMTTTLVRQVRNTALDLEDCIESVIHLDNNSNWWRRLLPSCMAASAPAASLEEVVADLEFLNARVEAMGQRNMRYSHISDTATSMAAEQTQRQQPASLTKPLDILVEARNPGNKKGSQRDLAELINNGNDALLQLQVIAVWGTKGDLGTTSIAKKAYDDPELCKNFVCRAWVRLTHPFNPHEFVRSLLAQFCSNSCPRQGSSRIASLKLTEVMVAPQDLLIDEFMNQVSSHRYLIVLEDVCMMVDWEAVRVFLPDNGHGSCIIVHTQQLEIASLCVGQSHQVLELEQFSADHSICVFFNENIIEDDDEVAKKESAREWLQEFQYCGRQTNLWLLRSLVACGMRGAPVLPVCGIAGVGKRSLVRQVYYEALTGQSGSPFQKFGWVDVSHPFDLKDLSWSLLLDLHSGSFRRASMLRIKDPVQECQRLLRRYRCLIVINGLLSKEEWDSIKAALAGHRQNRIVVIAHEESVARYCSEDDWLNVEGLEIDEALDLFKITVSKKIGPCALSLAVIQQAKLLLLKCGGLPKVIIAVANFVASRRLYDIGSENWSVLSYGFMEVLEANPAFGILQDVFAWVHSYFHSCPDFLKPCIFYLSIFPLNRVIRRKRLVRRWTAEGYSRDTAGSNAEENAEESYFQLFMLSMIQVPGQRSLTSYMRMPLCQVNGFLREYMISRSMEDNLVFALEGHCIMNSQRTGRHLTIGSTWDRDKIVFQSIDFKRLRSMTVFGEWKSFFISDKMKLLRVLDLEDSSGVTDKDLYQMVRLLPRLKFLSLRGCKAVTCLPKSLGGMRHLQTLDIRHTSVVRLPLGVTKLQKLQYVRAGTNVPLDDDGISTVECLPQQPQAATTTTPSSSAPVSRFQFSSLWARRRQQPVGFPTVGIEVPVWIGKLMALHTMGVIDVSVASGRAILEELKDLTQLHKLGVSGVNQESCRELCSAISGHAHLESLSMWFDKHQGCLDCIPQPPEKLQSLKLYGHVENKLPAWIKLLPNLTKLSLQMTMITQELIDVLGDLKNLETLCLRFKELLDGDLQFGDGFEELQILEIAYNSRLQDVTIHFGADDKDNGEVGENGGGREVDKEDEEEEDENGLGGEEEEEVEEERSVMKSLELLKLRCCSASSMQFSGLNALTALKEVWLSRSYGNALKEHLQGKLPRKINLVLKEEP
ncbi:disease resistance protein RPM1-like [Panicum virgatum]|uniref:Uncharacterized protein n=1 Tax=Panicum virgatum TaxID=38727 RepID=A0A8T0XQR1_PANVG|nr:disease resistance protein RPM1-like [Panicum virgatum]KAG2657789.1 hypothetical protein PVAP13_1KG201020 [Panicum virgatum]